MNQTLKNDKKPYFGPDFDLFDLNVGPKKFLWVLPLLDFMHCCKLSLCATSWKSNERSFRKRQKTSFWVRLWTIRSKFGAPFFFFKNLAFSGTIYHGQLSSCTISKKLTIQSSENVVRDRCTGGETNRQTNRVIS